MAEIRLGRGACAVYLGLLLGSEIGIVAFSRVFWINGGGDGEKGYLWMMRIVQCGAFSPIRRYIQRARQGPRNRVYPPFASSPVFVSYIPRFFM